MARSRIKDTSILLPWERRGGFLQRPGIARVRPLLLIAGVIALFVVVAHRERQAAGIRATRAALLVLRQAVDTYRADNGWKCPPELLELEKRNYIKKVPVDAWGNSFVLTCPGRFDPKSYDLVSAGPDGIPGGLDRVE